MFGQASPPPNIGRWECIDGPSLSAEDRSLGPAGSVRGEADEIPSPSLGPILPPSPAILSSLIPIGLPTAPFNKSTQKVPAPFAPGRCCCFSSRLPLPSACGLNFGRPLSSHCPLAPFCLPFCAAANSRTWPRAALSCVAVSQPIDAESNILAPLEERLLAPHILPKSEPLCELQKAPS